METPCVPLCTRPTKPSAPTRRSLFWHRDPVPVHVFRSTALQTLVSAAPGRTGRKGDWIHEIHLTPTGQRKLDHAMGGAFVDAVLSGYPRA